MSKKKEHLPYHTYVRLTEQQKEDLVYLARQRGETQSDTLRACLVAVVKQAKRKGIWKEDK